MKCQHDAASCKQFSEKSDDQVLNSLHGGCLAKRLFFPVFSGTSASAALHNPGASDNIAQLSPLLWSACLSKCYSFARAMIMNGFNKNLLDAGFDLNEQRQHVELARRVDHFLIGLKNDEDGESNDSDAKDNIKSSPTHSKATLTQEKASMFLNQQSSPCCESKTMGIRLGAHCKKKKVHHSQGIECACTKELCHDDEITNARLNHDCAITSSNTLLAVSVHAPLISSSPAEPNDTQALLSSKNKKSVVLPPLALKSSLSSLSSSSSSSSSLSLSTNNAEKSKLEWKAPSFFSKLFGSKRVQLTMPTPCKKIKNAATC